ncbi:MAG: HD domain-containing protein [Candidatus Omnitrophota bacterium]|nr:HD domain-containing protein [Candidatus Omnitrophota bacterium]
MRRNNHIRILVVERSKPTRDLVSDVLLQEGYLVCCARSAKEGWKAFSKDNFAVVIMNLNLPQAVSLKLLKMIKKRKPECSVVVISNNPFFSSVQKAISQGAYDYLTIPFRANELSFVIRNTVGVSNLGNVIQGLRSELSKEQLILKSQNELIRKESTEKIERIDKLYKDLQDTYMLSIRALIQTIDARDHYTHRHSVNVTRYATAVAKGMGLNAKEVESIKEACALHDLGKVAVHDYILNKPGKLTQKEWVQMKLHSSKGAQILAPLSFLNGIIDMVRQHHERYDGKGYPDGRKGGQIYLGSRIIAIADAYDAMISKRPYRKKPLTQEQAICEIKRNRGTQFDPRVVDVFLKIFAKK